MPHRPRSPRAAGPLAALMLLALAGLAACSSGGGTATPPPAGASATASAPAPGPTSTPTAPGATLAPTADATAVIEVRDFELDPATVSITGATIALDVTNAGPTIHNVTVRDDAGTDVLASRDLREGETETVVGAIPPGTYDLYCSLPGHESLGIRGSLTVVAP